MREHSSQLNVGPLSDYPSPLEASLPTLEERVTRLEKDMDEQKKLRAAQDLDQSDFGQKLRVQHGLIQAIQQTQSEHTATLASHTATLARHTATLAEHGQRLDRLEGKVDRLEGKVDRLEGKVDRLEGKVDRLEGKVDRIAVGVEGIVGMLGTLIERDRER
ncbi:hypothetical protein [Actinoplanes xinjiangensis]|uniref:hypothetical protein n=1 Tax=Actinoplanes xinjiangensis TaxID=512350 RepID=UPI003446A4FC